ncbi:MAG: DUF4250 domain-containing protein [Lachnospiraceae bacterium]|nr:DUF4250 domain-containing protein [Lachnospiraceae bacterium]
MPKDPVMLLSYVNLKLRDAYSSLNDLCLSENVSEEEIRSKLESIGYKYNSELNQFK